MKCISKDKTMTPRTDAAGREAHGKSKDSLLPTRIDRWGIAYCHLAIENKSLVEDYEPLMEKETGLPSDASNQERSNALLLVE